MDGCAVWGMADRCELLLIAMASFNIVPSSVSAVQVANVYDQSNTINTLTPQNQVTFSILVKAYKNAKQDDSARAVINRIKDAGLKPGVDVYNSLMSMVRHSACLPRCNHFTVLHYAIPTLSTLNPQKLDIKKEVCRQMSRWWIWILHLT
jgi:pentatricopeptide repeat protein